MPSKKELLGQRYVCFSCSTRFYDLNRPEPTCPSCGADQRENPNPAPHEVLLARLRRERRKAPKVKPPPVEESSEEEEEEEEEEEGT